MAALSLPYPFQLRLTAAPGAATGSPWHWDEVFIPNPPPPPWLEVTAVILGSLNSAVSARRGKGASVYGSKHNYLGNSLTTCPLTERDTVRISLRS